ncbi:MAG: 50S ribosomal protein L20 [Patescibacteria group bacterium]|nr:50S ribosomal protein L20 [Patescibacteria group bacterium]
MVRVKRGKIAHKKREKILRYTKGFKWGRKSKERLAKEALLHAWTHAFEGRKLKKRDFRRLWQTKIKAAVNQGGLKYNEFINLLKKNNVKINRKILAQLAEFYPEVFSQIVSAVK